MAESPAKVDRIIKIPNYSATNEFIGFTVYNVNTEEVFDGLDMKTAFYGELHEGIEDRGIILVGDKLIRKFKYYYHERG